VTSPFSPGQQLPSPPGSCLAASQSALAGLRALRVSWCCLAAKGSSWDTKTRLSAFLSLSGMSLASGVLNLCAEDVQEAPAGEGWQDRAACLSPFTTQNCVRIKLLADKDPRGVVSLGCSGPAASTS